MKSNLCGKYLRLSKEDLLRKDESSSIESQRMIIESFCNFNGLKLVKEYVDDGYSGGNFERPGFKKMLDDIESGKIDCVITKDLSRLGREIYQTGTFIEEYFTNKGIRYIAINDGYDSLDGADDMLPMRLTMNDHTLRDTSKKVKSSFRARQKSGEYIGSFPKYGYLKDKNDHHHLVPDPVASNVVKRIFNMALAGNTPHRIASQLTLEKVAIPIVYKKDPRSVHVTDNDGYGIWKPQTIRSILTSEMYIGNMVQNTFNKIRYNSKKIRATSKEEYIIVENTHEALIDKETFDRVNKLMKARSRTVSKKADKYLFSGLLRCKECGHNISILEKKNKKNDSHYTQCNLYTKKGKYGICSIHRVNYNWLEEDLIKIIRSVCRSFLTEYDNKALAEEANEILKEDINRIQINIDNISKEIVKLNKAIEELYMDKVEEKIPILIFNKLIEKYNSELKDNNHRKDEFEKEKLLLISKIETLDYDSCSKIVKKFIEIEKPTRAMISELINKIEISDDKKIKVYFNFEELTGFVR